MVGAGELPLEGLGGPLVAPLEGAERFDAGGTLAAADTLARCTSHAARLARAPPRSYSCSTRMSRLEAGAKVAWQRWRAWMEAASSAKITKSRFPRALPSHVRA